MRSAEAAMPSTASARRSQLWSGALIQEAKRKKARLSRAFSARRLLPGRHLLQLGAELLQRGPRVHARRARLLDPVLDDRVGALLHLGEELGVRAHDLDVRLLERVQARLVGAVPGLAVAARRVLVGVLLDDLLVLRRDLVPLVLVHEEAERGAVHAAREER